MHLSPSTDTETALLMSQIGLEMQGRGANAQFREKEQIINFQELGGIGFYGIQNNEDTMISMLLMTNGSDMCDEYYSKKIGYNNVQ